MKIHKSIALALAVATTGTGITYTPSAAAQWAVFDPTNYVQNYLTQLRAVQSNVNEVRQIQAQLQQYDNMLRNTKSLDVRDLGTAIEALSRLDRVIGEGKSLAVTASNYDEAFKARFPGYQTTTNYSENYREWSDTSRDSVLGALRVANLQVRAAMSEEEALESLRAAVTSADGQKAAVDAGNQIALAQITQLQQLRELMVAQMQASGTYMAAQQQMEASKAASVREATKYRDPRKGWEAKPIRIGQ
ncbi:P-type conjugative transfer protein TrbJ [Lysobacter auxotrophicus]|uniref:P-type conjugative transfer protein TrbJ n=1 Tax=Lysobacter auxotrophicus TaxID=2992573 RepID=A0ABN6UGF8_9GAMM|nr:P-type conjugative transfer protein TrbJ [Lysobacter auxotrophicus]BDU15386.1 P-type conjugative transfer protein TrbJ [Lysobacter auxotrophicus]